MDNIQIDQLEYSLPRSPDCSMRKHRKLIRRFSMNSLQLAAALGRDRGIAAAKAFVRHRHSEPRFAFTESIFNARASGA